MKMTLAGLLETPEVCLARACLRRLNDPSDTLATAEIRALGACEEPEVWLADRLRWLASGEQDRDWAEADDSIVSRIAHLRGQSMTQSPVEIVARVLNYVGVRPIVTAWGPDAITAAQRQRNLDAFLHLSVEYETTAHCSTSGHTDRVPVLARESDLPGPGPAAGGHRRRRRARADLPSREGTGVAGGGGDRLSL